MKLSARSLWVALAILSLPAFSYAQSGTASLSGRLLDSGDEPVAFANVALYASGDSTLVKVEITDEDGAFHLVSLSPGCYWLDLSYVGMAPLVTEAMTLRANEDRELSPLHLQASSNDLDEVVVTAERPLLELKADRMVFNIENSVNAAGNNALELLRKSPGVVVDNNDNITMMGRSGVRIFIDGKPSPLRGDDLTNYLRTLQSTEIDAIEIITNPSSKYEAEGNAGIINIRLKKDQNLGANGNLNLGYAIGETPRYNGSINGNFRNTKLNLFGNYGYSDNANISFMDMHREQVGNAFDQYSNESGQWQAHNFKGGLDLFLSDKSTLGALVTGNLSQNAWKSHSRTEMGTVGNPGIDSVLIADSDTHGDRENLNFNVNYRFDNGNGKSLNIDADYGMYRNSGFGYQPNRYFDPTETVLLSERINQTETPTDIDIYTLKLDYELPFLDGKFGTGFKLSYVETDNTFDFYDIVDGSPVLNIDRSNNFVYKENVNAAYVNYNRNLGEKVTFQLGLRAEQTNSRGLLTADKPTDNDDVKRNYLDLFPTGSISYALNEDHSFQLAAGRRINRPSYQDLNPFLSQLNELVFRRGNPFLRPEYTTNVQLTHTFKYKLNTTLSFSKTTDLITEQTDTLGSMAAYITQLNLANQYNYSLNLSAPLPITDWWSTYTSVTAYYRHNKGAFEDGKSIDLSAKAFNLYSQQSFKLPLDIGLEISGWYNSPSLWGGNFEMDGQWSVDAGLQRKVLGGRGNLKLSVSDIFKTTNWHGFSSFGALDLNIRGGYDSRRFRVNFTYLIGNTNVKGARKRDTGLEDEQNRVGQ